MLSVANLATLQTPLATFFPSKKRPNLVTDTAARGLALPARAHTPLSLSLSLCVCSVSLQPQRTHLSPLSPLSASAQFSPACGREEQRFNSVKHRYYVASLILHSSIAEITAQLLSLSYVYLISSDDGSYYKSEFLCRLHLGRESWLCLNGSRFSHYFIFIPLSDNRNSKIYQWKQFWEFSLIKMQYVGTERQTNVIINNKCTFCMFRRRAALCAKYNRFVYVNCSVQRREVMGTWNFFFHVSNRHEQVL